MTGHRFKKKLYGDPFVNDFIAEMEGQKYNIRPYAWIDSKTGERYSCLSGALAMPTFEHDGYMITAGVRYDDQKIICLEEYQTDNEIELIREAARIKDRYGDSLHVFYGNPHTMMPIVRDMKKPVLISPPLDFETADNFQIYMSRLQSSLMVEAKSLMIADCNILRNHLMAFTKNKSARSDNNPVLYAAGSMVHTLLTARPWEQAVENIELIPTTGRDEAFMKQEEEKAVMAHLYAMGE